MFGPCPIYDSPPDYCRRDLSLSTKSGVPLAKHLQITNLANNKIKITVTPISCQLLDHKPDINFDAEAKTTKNKNPEEKRGWNTLDYMQAAIHNYRLGHFQTKAAPLEVR